MSHPLHPALVHFPIACWSLATLADFAGLWCGQPEWMLAAVLLAVGTASGLAAMAAGFAELVKLDSDSPAMRDVNRHMILAMATWSCYAASLFLRLQGAVAQPGAAGLALSTAGFFLLCATGWFGGNLVYRHGIGVARRDAAIGLNTRA